MCVPWKNIETSGHEGRGRTREPATFVQRLKYGSLSTAEVLGQEETRRLWVPCPAVSRRFRPGSQGSSDVIYDVECRCRYEIQIRTPRSPHLELGSRNLLDVI